MRGMVISSGFFLTLVTLRPCPRNRSVTAASLSAVKVPVRNSPAFVVPSQMYVGMCYLVPQAR